MSAPASGLGVDAPAAAQHVETVLNGAFGALDSYFKEAALDPSPPLDFTSPAMYAEALLELGHPGPPYTDMDPSDPSSSIWGVACSELAMAEVADLRGDWASLQLLAWGWYAPWPGQRARAVTALLRCLPFLRVLVELEKTLLTQGGPATDAQRQVVATALGYLRAYFGEISSNMDQVNRWFGSSRDTIGKLQLNFQTASEWLEQQGGAIGMLVSGFLLRPDLALDENIATSLEWLGTLWGTLDTLADQITAKLAAADAEQVGSALQALDVQTAANEWAAYRDLCKPLAPPAPPVPWLAPTLPTA
jgi:hypothetical protein